MAKTSVDSEATTKPALKYEPKSLIGKGFFPLLMRAWVHSLMVAYAVFRKWPITYEVAIAEMEEAIGCLVEIQAPAFDPMSYPIQKQFMQILNRLRAITEEIRQASSGKEKEAMGDEFSEQLHEVTNMIFALATALDFETLGLGPGDTDAGKNL